MEHEPDSAPRRPEPQVGQPLGPEDDAPSVEHRERVVEGPTGIEERESAVRDTSGNTHVERTFYDRATERRLRLEKASQLIWLVTSTLEGLFALRIFLKLIAANPASPFVGLVYNFTAVFLAPFFGITSNPAYGGVVLEVTSLIAMAVYALTAWAAVRAIWIIFSSSSVRSVSTYDRHRHR